VLHVSSRDTVTRLSWGDYNCLSYAWGDFTKKEAIIFLDGIATRVTKRLEAPKRRGGVDRRKDGAVDAKTKL
jgi:hypothetical protein